MILHEARELALVVEAGVEMLPRRSRVAVAEPVVQPLVVAVVESLLHQWPFQVPVGLGQE